MDDVLAVQVGQRVRHADADRHDIRHGQRRVVDPSEQRGALDKLHDDIGLAAEVARGDEFRRMRTGQQRQDHLLHFEADDGGGVVAVLHDRRLENGRRRHIVARHAPDMGHAADVEALHQAEAVDDIARTQVGK